MLYFRGTFIVIMRGQLNVSNGAFKVRVFFLFLLYLFHRNESIRGSVYSITKLILPCVIHTLIELSITLNFYSQYKLKTKTCPYYGNNDGL